MKTIVCMVCSALALIGQTGPPPAVPTMHAEARVVQIDVIAVGADGKPVSDLSKEDFKVIDNAKPRAIDIFSVSHGDAAVPLMLPPTSAQALPPNVFSNRIAGPPNLPGHSTVIVLDQLNIAHESNRIPFQTAADYQLQVTSLMNKVSADERIALYVLARQRGLVLLQDYTTDRNLLLSRLKSYIPWAMHFPLETHPDKPSAVPGPRRRDPNAVSSRETEQLAEDASRDTRMTLQALAEHLALVPGRKNVFLLRGPGPPLLMHGMNGMAWDKTVDALNEANVAVNTFGELAARTGGQTWHETFDLDAILANQIEASRTAYTLGFYLSEKDRDNEFHSVTVAVDRPGVQLFYRQGYYAGDTELPAASWEKSDKGEMEAALLNRVDSTGVGITARVDAVAGTPRGTVDIHLSLDPATLSLTAAASGWTGKVDEMFVEQNANGNTLSKVSDTKMFEVGAGSRAGFDANGVAWSMSIPLIEGATRIVMVVRDSKSGRMGSLSVPLM